MTPLSGKMVLVTRPAGGPDALSEELSRLGARVVQVPLLAFADPESFAPLDRALTGLAGYAAVAFTSANAVRRTLDRLGGPFPAGPQVVAVGPRTAGALKERGVRVDAVPEEHRGRALVGELERLLRGLSGKRILLPRAEVADEGLPEGVREAGGEMDVVPVYRTVIPAGAGSALESALARGVSAITLASPSAASHLVELLGGESRSRDRLEGIVLGALGDSTRERLAQLGLTRAVVSAPAPAVRLARALAEALT